MVTFVYENRGIEFANGRGSFKINIAVPQEKTFATNWKIGNDYGKLDEPTSHAGHSPHSYVPDTSLPPS